MASRTLEEQVARLCAVEDIKQLKARYCAYCDAQYDPAGLASLFVEDAVWDGGAEFGRHVGRQAIHDFFKSISGNILFAAHLVLNPIITVQGKTATGQWRLIMPCTAQDAAGKPEARWLLSAYDERYVEHEGRWMFQALTVTTQFFAAHATGWAEQTTAGR